MWLEFAPFLSGIDVRCVTDCNSCTLMWVGFYMVSSLGTTAAKNTSEYVFLGARALVSVGFSPGVGLLVMHMFSF